MKHIISSTACLAILALAAAPRLQSQESLPDTVHRVYPSGGTIDHHSNDCERIQQRETG
ncbi:MAG: hypothetical protein IPP94_11930 [Ignavibacteria bacterium]|nr:hypothetical protein [Ignavibacteria bacterium]